jgi:hypothetical protein
MIYGQQYPCETDTYLVVVLRNGFKWMLAADEFFKIDAVLQGPLQGQQKILKCAGAEGDDCWTWLRPRSIDLYYVSTPESRQKAREWSPPEEGEDREMWEP